MNKSTATAKPQFGRVSSIEVCMMAGILAYCGHLLAARYFTPSAQENLATEITALEAANRKRNQLDRLSLNLNLIHVDDKTTRLNEADCRLVREAVGKPQKLLAEFLSANDVYYSYHARDPMTQTRRDHDSNAMRYSAQESDRMIARRMEFCR